MGYVLRENLKLDGWDIVRENGLGDEGEEHVVATFYEYIKATDYLQFLNGNE